MTVSNKGAPLPLSLKIVAWLFILGGVASVIDFLNKGNSGISFLSFVIGVFGFWIGSGLLQLNQTSRIAAVIFVQISMVGIIVGTFFAVLLMIDGQPLHYDLPFIGYGKTEGWAALVPLFFIFMWQFWQLRVLNSPLVKWLFGLDASAGAAAWKPKYPGY
ncbi:MAG: hypothetical protein ABIP97_03770 [Chthoniobacterales bacterium]